MDFYLGKRIAYIYKVSIIELSACQLNERNR